MIFRKLSGDVNWQEYGGKFISKKLNNDEFDYWLVMEVINWYEATGTDDGNGNRYNVALYAVSPSEAGEANLKSAFESEGFDEEFLSGYGNDPLIQVEALSSYGIQAILWQANGNNLRKLMKDARKQADLANMLLGFFMDRTQNQIGSTGWDFIKGDIMAGLQRIE